jgi:hypothetical protein
MKRYSSAARFALGLIAVLGLAGQVAAAAQLPFHGSFDGVVTRAGAPPIVSVDVNADGVATHLGRFTLDIPHTVNVVTRTATGTYTFVAANGETLTADFVGQSTPTADPTVLYIEEEATITGGTGRFAHASGSFVCERFYDTVAGTTTGSFEGTISSPGAAKH